MAVYAFHTKQKNARYGRFLFLQLLRVMVFIPFAEDLGCLGDDQEGVLILLLDNVAQHGILVVVQHAHQHLFVLFGVRTLAVQHGDAGLDGAGQKKPKVSVFSNVDYLIGKFRDSRRSEKQNSIFQVIKNH